MPKEDIVGCVKDDMEVLACVEMMLMLGTSGAQESELDWLTQNYRKLAIKMCELYSFYNIYDNGP